MAINTPGRVPDEESADANDGAAAAASGIPPIAGMRHLCARLFELAKRRPRRGLPIPRIYFQGEGADRMVRGFRERLRVGGKGSPTVPHALVDFSAAAVPSSFPAFVDQVVDGLERSTPGGRRGMAGAWGLRFPCYRTIRNILDAPAPVGPLANQRRQLRAHLYTTRGALGPPAGGLDAVVRWLRARQNWLGAIAAPAVGLSKLLYNARLNRGFRFRWFRKVCADAGAGNSFVDAGLLLAPGARGQDTTTLVQQVLTLALAHDLQSAIRPSLSPFRRRRVTPFVLLLVDVTAGSPGHHFLEMLATVPGENRRWVRVRRHTLMALVSSDPACDGTPQTTTPYSLGEAAEALDPLLGRNPTQSLPVITVEVADGPVSNPDLTWLLTHPLVQPMPVRGAVAVPVISAAALVVAAVLVWLRLPGPDVPRCPQDIEGEMVGVWDGIEDCSFFPHADDTATDVDDAMADVQAAIARENATIDDSDRYATIVFFAPLTVPEGQGLQGENALNQLRGTALAQLRANDAADLDPNKVYTRVIIANPGDRFSHGVDVAELIIDRADSDRTILGVVGISQSRSDSQQAINILHDGQLPVVAGPVTGDSMINSSPHYYQISARNRRVARMLVEFSTNTEIVGAGDETAIPEGAVVVMDHTDAYSHNLGYDFYDDFVATGRAVESILTLPIENPDEEVPPSPVDEAPDATEVGSLDELAQQVCTSLGERDIVFYAGRAQQFPGMWQSMHDNNDCPDTFTVVGGSALTKIVEDPSSSLRNFRGMNLYYAAHASRRIDRITEGDDLNPGVDGINSASNDFMTAYEDIYGSDVLAPDISDAAVAYDAFAALQLTANQAVQNGVSISAESSAHTLADEQIEFDGASGYIALGNGPINSDHPRVPRDKVVLVLPAAEANPEHYLVCGRLSQDVSSDTWGPDDRECPDIN